MKTMPFRCTLTGVDELSSLEWLGELSSSHPFVEWGVLFSFDRAGAGRYPGIDWIARFPERLDADCALHLCGSSVHRLLAGDVELREIAARYGRIQLNFNQTRNPLDLDALNAFIGGWSTPVITQHNSANETIWSSISAPNHQVLFDASGGRGVSPASFPRALPGKCCGFAGGIGPDNVADRVVDAWGSANELGYWIDMENKLRSDEDVFLLERCEQVLSTISPTPAYAAGLGKGPARELIHALATQYGVEYVPDPIDELADQFSRLSGDDGDLDETELLLVALSRADVVQGVVVTFLHDRYLNEIRPQADVEKERTEARP